MSTRSAIIVRQKIYGYNNEVNTQNLFNIYRHWDGYPEVAGADIANAIVNSQTTIDDPSVWCKCVMEALFSDNVGYEIEGSDYQHGDLEYLYVIEGNLGKFIGNEVSADVTMYVYRTDWNKSYQEMQTEENLLFKGNANEYSNWLNNIWPNM